MRRTSLDRLLLGIILASLVMATGCTYYHSLYFERSNKTDVRIDRFRVTPRIFAYQDQKSSSKMLEPEPFSVTVRVEVLDYDGKPESWKAGQDVIDSVSDEFLAEAAEVFTVDSLVLHQIGPENEQFLLIHDRDNLSPRRENYFTLRFGNIDLPPTTKRLRTVLHYSRHHDSGETVQDSVFWVNNRVMKSRQGIKLGRDTVRGYE
jgi:hypothetical protein